MALTLANVSHPNQMMSEFNLGPWKARVVRITFDSSYLTTGEVLAASALGWSNVIGAMPLTGVSNVSASGTAAVPVVVRPNAAQTSLTFQAYETAAAVDTVLKEVTSAQDLSTFVGDFIVLGS